MVLKVLWKSTTDPKLLEGSGSLPGHHFVAGTDGSPCDVAVLDLAFFSSQDQFEADLRSLESIPKLVVVTSPESEFSLIERGLAGPLDEFCHGDRATIELVPRLRRLMERVNGLRPPYEPEALTGLMSRQSLFRYINSFLPSASPERPFSVLLIDIDHFKRINDQLGHRASDGVLRAIAEILKRRARGVECLARSGGDEFAILVWAQTDQAAGLAEFLRGELERERFEGGLQVTVSVGVGTTYKPVADAELWQVADTCVYRAKAEGRNRVVTSADLQDSTDASPDADLLDFETRMRVVSERFGEELALRGRQMAKRYREEAERDGLTGLYNRRHLDKRLPREMENAIRHKRKLSLVMLDLDHFGEVNRTYGFPGGDRALRLVAGAVGASVRSVDWVARYGGEEFCVVMPDTPLVEGLAVAERLREAIRKDVTHAFDGREISVTASLGVVELDGERGEACADPVALIQAASDKVREAKNGGRDRVCS